MIRRPPRSTRTDTLFPYTTLFRSQAARGVASEQGALWTSLHLDTAHVIEFRQGGNGRGHVDIVRIQRDRGFIRKAEIVQLYATDCHAGNDGCIGDLETRDQVDRKSVV